MAETILISACLAGLRTRYDGCARPHRYLKLLRRRATIVPVCPEILGGLGIPRKPCRFFGGDGARVLDRAARVFDNDGLDLTQAFLRGAWETFRIAEILIPDLILFKEGSPSCGTRRVDIDGIRQAGCGVTTALLRRTHIPIISEDEPLPKISAS